MHGKKETIKGSTDDWILHFPLLYVSGIQERLHLRF
jgi:hypothetical protein